MTRGGTSRPPLPVTPQGEKVTRRWPLLSADELKTTTELSLGRARYRAMESAEICRQLDFHMQSTLMKFVQKSVQAALRKQRAAIAKKKREILFQNVGNLNRDGIQLQILEMRQQLMNETAAEIFSIYCEAWKSAGKRTSAAFIRFVRDARILPLIAPAPELWTRAWARFWRRSREMDTRITP